MTDSSRLPHEPPGARPGWAPRRLLLGRGLHYGLDVHTSEKTLARRPGVPYVAMDAVLSDGAVERAARALFEYSDAHGGPLCTWDELVGFHQNEYRARARAALTAALGDPNA